MPRNAIFALILPVILLAAVVIITPAATPSLAQTLPTATTDPFTALTLMPTLYPTLAPTPTWDLTPHPTAAAPGCGSIYPIGIGDEVRVRSGVHMRILPSINGPLIRMITDDVAGWYNIIGGPVCADNYTWWMIEMTFTRGTALEPEYITMRGWIVERTVDTSFILGYNTAGRECVVALNLVVGEKITLVRNVRLRREPSLSGLVLTVAPVGTVATVMEAETVCADGYVWRHVQLEALNTLYDGWMAEGTRLVTDETTGASGSDSYIDRPQPQCDRPLNLEIGQLGRVTYKDTLPKNLRDEPGRDGAILYSLVKGIPLEVIGGPLCRDGINWWQVRILAPQPVEGWMGEGTPLDPWIQDFDYHPDLDPYRCCDHLRTTDLVPTPSQP